MWRVRLLLLLATVLSPDVPLLASPAAAAEKTPGDVLLLAQARAHMSDLLTRLPNYTCLQTIERTRRTPGGRMQLMDMVRIEVALVDGNELFAWPGSRKFEDTKIIDMVKGGAIGNGNFALHAKSVFQGRAPQFTFIGERIREDGRQTYRWDFVVPQITSGYLLRSGDQEAIVGYHGSFWVDSKTLDVVRLEVYADDIPQRLKIASASDAVDYQRAQLGGEPFLLPSTSELRLSSPGGHESVNRTTFSGCRQYTGESTISFEDARDGAKQSKIAERTLDLPKGLLLQTKLETPLTEGVSAVGDPVTATLGKALKIGTNLLAPKGALLHGRITHLRRQDSQQPGWIVGMTFFELEWENTRATLRAVLESTPILELTSSVASQFRMRAKLALDEGAFLVPGARLSLSRGFPMYWRTQPLNTED